MKLKLTSLMVCMSVYGYTQTQLPATGSPPTPPNSASNNAASAWFRGGNNPVGATPATSNIFGTMFDSPVYHFTSGVQRMVLNGNNTTPTSVAAGPQNTSGFLGINTNNPLSRVHIAAPNSTAYGGYRGWMREGLTLQENNDQLWLGHKKWGLNPDQLNAVINWGDDPGLGFNGSDHLVFNFTASTYSGPFATPGITPNSQTQEGLEIMRLTDIGLVGIGPRFSNQFPPQSTLHQHQENSAPSWMQITNQASPILNNVPTNVTVATPITPNDGLRWGIDGANTGFFYNQENNHLLFSTNKSVIPGLGTTNERMRISQIGAPGIPNPGSVFPNDVTRVSISHNPNTPVTRPLSLLHLGYNTQGATNDGWRPWMDVGMYVSQSSDNVFLGLKNESLTPLGDQLDAVLSWGDNQVNSGLPPFNGPDKFRFIFTSSQAPSSPGSTQAKSANGLEAMRMNPTLTNGVYTGIGGDPSGNPYSGGVPNPNNTLEVNSWGATTNPGGSSGLRLTNLTIASPTVANPGTGVLSVDANGDVIYVQGGGNGLGNICGITPQNPLPNNWEIPMNGFNFNYTMPANSSSSFHIGNTVCVPTLARMNVNNDNLQIATAITSNLNSATTSFGVFSNITNAGTGNLISVQGTANSSGSGSTARGVRGEAIAVNGSIAEGVKGISNSNNNCSQNIAVGGLAANGVTVSIAGDFDVEVSNSPLNVGVQTDVINGNNSSSTNFGVQSIVNNMGTANYGGFFAAVGATSNYGIFAQGVGSTSHTPGGPAPLVGNYAGYFNGDVVRTGTDNFTSDANLKQNIDTITNALGIIKQLKPKSYEYKQSSFPSMNLPGGKQYGLIAQDVQTVLPEIVNDNVHPAKVDSLGNVIVPAFNYLSLEYQQLTGIMIKAIQEQQAKIDSLTKKLNAKDSIQDARLTALENAIAQCCSNASARNANINQLDVELSDKDAIVLNQNVPNPFAEQTTITYNVPSSVEKAQLIFFNSNGQVIQTVDIKTRGKGKVNVFAADLSSGLYHYTLVADGKVVDSKKMVRE